MKTLIVYATKYGTTEKCVKKLTIKLIGEVKVYNLKDEVPSLDGYDKVVIGGSIYIGQIQKDIINFCNEKEGELLAKTLGLFIVCMGNEEMAQKQLTTAYPPKLFQHAVVKEIFGGEFQYKKMGFMDKLITRVIAKTSQDVSKIDYEKIIDFAKVLNELK
jgi:menaquinone-dependent protoporphyrinogen oxidase